MGMTFDGLPRDVVLAVNKLGGEYGSEVEGAALLSELQAMGHDPDTYRMVDLMKHLKESGYLTFYRAQGGVEAIDMIQLGPRGLQAVAGWPTDGSLTAGQVEALISAIEARAESAGSEAEGGKLRVAAAALRDAGVSAVGEAVGVWLSKQAGMG